MYIAMNRFQVATDRAEEFETMWRQRETFLHEVPGFQGFRLLRSGDTDGVTLFASHTTWASHDAFVAWTSSEAFKKAHAGARPAEGVVVGPPKFEGFEVVLDQA